MAFPICLLSMRLLTKIPQSEGKTVLLTFGLLSPNKGFESVIRALPRILSRHKKVVYIIAGATHPHVRRREGDRYRIELQDLAESLGLKEHVIFVNRFVGPQEMASLVGSAEYLHHPVPIRGTGRVRHARAGMPWARVRRSSRLPTGTLLKSWRMVAETIVAFDDSAAIADNVTELLDNEELPIQAMRKRAYLYARDMIWDQVARSYMQSFVRAGAGHRRLAREVIPSHSCRLRTPVGDS